jgi:hypothetical protein
MPIEVTCDECFTPHSVKSEFAGKRFKCRECGAALVVPRKSAVAAGSARSAPPPPRAAAPSPAATSQKKRSSRSGSKSRSRAGSSGWLSGPRGWIVGGVGLLVIVALVLVPQFLGILAMPLVLAGIALTLWGALKCLASAFEEDVTCGLMWIFVPFYSVFFTLTRWDTVGRYFLTFVGGIALMWTPMYGMKLITQAQQQARDYDPTTEIARDYDDSGLDDQVVAFQQPRANAAAGSRPVNPAAGDTLASSAGGQMDRTGGARPADSARSGPAAGGVPRAPGRQPPPADVLDGRPEPLPFPPRSAKPLIHIREPIEPGSEVWIDDKGWWYAGTVTAPTEKKFYVMVQFDGWEDRSPQEVPTAGLRQRTQMSDETVRYKLKIISVDGPREGLAERIDAKLAQSYGYVAGSAEVDFENYLVIYETQRGGDLDEMKGAVFSLHSAGVESQGIGVVKDTTPSGELMVGQVHYKDYTGTIPLEEVADLALRGYSQYVPGSGQVDEQAGVIRFVFDPNLVEDSYFKYTPLQQLMNALSYFSFGQLSQPEATPYQRP